MKTLKTNLKRLALVAVIAVSVFAVSCSKDYDPVPYQALSFENSEMKKSSAPARGAKSIAEIAIEAGFSELVSALVYVDSEIEGLNLVEMFLTGTDQYTVFAPTNEAFQNLYTAVGATEISDLPADLVLNVLLYHVAEGRRAANSVVPPVRDRRIETLLGTSFSVSAKGMITAVGNTANIAAADVSASNGIIHVIDAVILPITL